MWSEAEAAHRLPTIQNGRGPWQPGKPYFGEEYLDSDNIATKVGPGYPVAVHQGGN